VALVAAAAGAAVAWQIKPAPAAEPIRFAVSNEGLSWTGTTRQVIDISPDGRSIVYVAAAQLHVRTFASGKSTPISGTETHVNVFSPSISPDGQSVAFYGLSERAIMRVPIGGGSPFLVTRVRDNPFALTWTDEGITFSLVDGVMIVSPGGGTPRKLAGVAPTEQVQRVQLLPGGRVLLFTIAPKGATTASQWAGARVVAERLDSGERTTLIEGGSDGWYVQSGHLTYAVGGVVHAVPFDVERLERTGAPVPMVEGVRRAALGGGGTTWFAASGNGTLAYVPGPTSIAAMYQDVAFVDRKGAVVPLKLPPAGYEFPRASRDGRKIVVTADDGRESAVLIYDVVRGGTLQSSVFGGRNRLPIWTADSNRVVFQSDREGDLGIFWQRADGTAGPERLTRAASGEAHVPESAHRAGDVLLYSIVKGSEHALWTYSIREKKSAPFAGVRSDVPTDATFSPDGKWVAYTVANASFTTIYVQPFPATGAIYQLVRNAGDVPHHPLWSPEGNELIFNPAPGSVDIVSITTTPTFAFGTRQAVPRPFTTGPPALRRNFDMAPDGRFIALVAPGTAQGAPAAHLSVVMNWFEELKAQAPQR
jgi:serine/threonine-protein kinase